MKTILKKVSRSLMLFIEIHCIAGFYGSHCFGDAGHFPIKKQVKVIVHEAPCNYMDVVLGKVLNAACHKALSVGVFPEGTRGDGKTLGKFHAGCFKVALKTGCPIVVAAIRGTKQAHERTPWLSTEVNFDIIDVLSPKGRKSVELSELVREKIEGFLAGKK